jgi:hypothetical protein
LLKRDDPMNLIRIMPAEGVAALLCSVRAPDVAFR